MTRALGRAFAVFLTAVFLFPGSSLAADTVSQQEASWEMQAGQQQFAELMQKGEIVPQSPMYAMLQPVADRVGAVASAQYFTRFHFYLVNERQPNAFAVPGGNVYVTTAMMQFAHSQDELAGVLCHEVSHDIHHDAYNNTHKVQNLGLLAGLLGALSGGSYLGQIAVGMGAQAQAKSYTRAAESNADKAGAYACAQAGYNPWGMVWLFRRLNGQSSHGSMEMMSDHPRDDHRVSDLETVFRSDPATFGRFADDPSSATPFSSMQQPQVGAQGQPQYPRLGQPQQGPPQNPPN